MIKTTFSGREKNIAILCVVLAVAFVLYRGIYVPLQNINTSLDAKILSAQKQWHKDVLMIGRAKAFKDIDPALYSRIHQSSSDDETFSFLLSELKSLAEANNLNVQDLKSHKLQKTKEVHIFALNVIVSGNLKDQARFMNMLQHAPYLYVLDEWHIQSNPKQNNLQLKLEVSQTLLQS